MKIDIDVNTENDTKKLLPIDKKTCARPIWRIVALICSIFVFIALLFIVRFYLKVILLWLENQQQLVKLISILILFTCVALPIAIGYIIMVCLCGYLYGFLYGLPLVVIGANLGIFIAHNILKNLRHHSLILQMTETPTAQAIKKLITGPKCFKIVLFSRLTPIPFGLQNTIFALSNVNTGVYHIASLIGLFPTQVLAVYLGSTLRSIQDIWEHKHISSSAYVIIILQLVIDASMMFWVAYRARKELMKALAEAGLDIEIYP